MGREEEVDLIVKNKEILPIEVKKKPKITKSFRSFISDYNPRKGIVANLDKLGRTKIGKCVVYNVPFVYF